MRKGLLLVVIAHALVAGWHGLTHLKVPVDLSPSQGSFVAIVVMLLPLLGAALSFSRFRAQGAAFVCLSMGASLAFGIIYHYVVASPDNIALVPPGPWQGHFIHSALAVLISEALGTLCGAAAWWQWSRSNAELT